ncbi:MAG: CHAT domain-containing protein [Bacteroidota bacterium]
MARFRKWEILFLLIFFPIILLGQNKDTTWYKLKARKLASTGAILSREGLDIEALDTFKLYLEYRKKIYGEENYFLGSPYLAVGVGYKNLGQNSLALEYYELAEKNYLLRDDQNTRSLGLLYINIGNAYRAKLDYKNALNYFEQALSVFLNQNPVDQVDISKAYYSIAEINYLMQNFEFSLSILEKYVNDVDVYNKILFNELIALNHQELNNTESADTYYKKTIDLIKAEYGSDDMDLAIEYMNYAEFLSTINQYDYGIENLDKAYDIISNSQQTKGIELAEYYEYKGDLVKKRPIETQNISNFKYKKRQNLLEAINWYNKSLQALYLGNDEVKFESVEIGDWLSFADCLIIFKSIADTYNELAILDREDKNNLYVESLKDALEYYEVIGNLVQRARKEISSDESKIQLAELEYSTFSKTIETAYLAYDVTHATEFIELAFLHSEQLKSSAIFDKLSDDLARENSLVPDSLIQKEKRLNSIIAIYTQKIFEENSYEEPDSKLISEYNEHIYAASRKRDELNRHLEGNYSDYYQLKYSESMLALSELQNKLSNNEAVLEYIINETDSLAELYTFVVTKQTLEFNKQELSSGIQNSIENLFNFMSDHGYLFTKNEDAKRFSVDAYELYNLLISPHLKEIQGKNLILIPDGKLSYISFDALLQTLPDTSKTINFSKLDYLIKNYNLNYANSANILFRNRNNSKKINNKTLAFAPEYNGEPFETTNARSFILSPLPGVQKEVESISKTVKTKIFRNTEASESNFRKHCKDYDILHLAMHAFIDDSIPARSSLTFSPKSKENKLENNGIVQTADIYNLELNARLTVLSACNTGIGKLQKGEGIMSLARGFLYAGCPSIVMSLWEVEDESGTRIMSSFYKNLKKGKQKDAALRLAKLDYLENSNSRQAHPHYWMGFVSIGDNSPIYTGYDIYFFAFLLLLIIAFTIDQIIRIKKARRKRQAL